MKKYLIVLLLLTLVLLSGCGNMKNSIGVNESNAIMVFSDTGIDVRNNFDRIYHIIKDKNGYLYYCSDVENNLTPVLDSEGKHTKDINVFTGQ